MNAVVIVDEAIAPFVLQIAEHRIEASRGGRLDVKSDEAAALVGRTAADNGLVAAVVDE